jgi:hypothetical protein
VAADRGGGLFVVLAQRLPSRSVDEMRLATDQALHCLIGGVIVRGRGIGDPSLHFQARDGASVDQSSHGTPVMGRQGVFNSGHVLRARDKSPFAKRGTHGFKTGR